MNFDKLICNDKFLTIVVAICAIILIMSTYADYAIKEGCESRGGKMVSDGDATYIVIGNVAVPFDSEKCSLEDGNL